MNLVTTFKQQSVHPVHRPWFGPLPWLGLSFVKGGSRRELQSSSPTGVSAPSKGADSARVTAPVWLTLSFITEAEGEGAPHASNEK